MKDLVEVAIIGGGPSGLLIAHQLGQAGINHVVLEKSVESQILDRIRAGVLKPRSVKIMEQVGLGERILEEKEDMDHIKVSVMDEVFDIPLGTYMGRKSCFYGQQKLQEDLMGSKHIKVQYNCEVTLIEDVEGGFMKVCYLDKNSPKDCLQQITARYVIGCEGGMGSECLKYLSGKTEVTISKKSSKSAWLSCFASSTPIDPALIYGLSSRGFFLCSNRGPSTVRLYLEVPNDTDVNNWSDGKEFRLRLPVSLKNRLVTGKIEEKAVVPVRGRVVSPVSFENRIFLVGDSAHIVPPTGANGLNLAMEDAYDLGRYLIDAITNGNVDGLNRYNDECVRRSWEGHIHSWNFTEKLHILHKDKNQVGFDLSKRV